MTLEQLLIETDYTISNGKRKLFYDINTKWNIIEYNVYGGKKFKVLGSNFDNVEVAISILLDE